MDPVRNPYSPNAGAVPEVMVGREAQTESFGILLQRLELDRTSQSMIITGLRGVGKTVLLNRFREIAEGRRWKVIEIEASKHSDQAFARALATAVKATLLQISPRSKWNDKMRRAAEILTSFSLSYSMDGTFSLGWDIKPSAGYADRGSLGLDLTDVFISLGEAAQSAQRGVVLLIDEVQFLLQPELEGLIQAMHKTVQRRLPVTFVGAGLPQIAKLAGDAKSYAERLFKFPQIGSLSDDEASLALTEPAFLEGVEWEGAAVERAVEITQGYPYFLQEIGYQAWEIAENDLITANDIEDAKEAYESKLDGSFFRVRLDRATELQTAYLRAMAELGPQPQSAADVAELLGRESTQVGPTRSQLIEMGLLYTPSHGYAAFTVPDFDKFMLRAVPTLEVPKMRKRRKR